MIPSLEQLAGYKLDAFAQPVPFVPENIKFDEIVFVPWVRAGLSAAIASPAAGELRGTVAVTIELADQQGHTASRTKKLSVRGPGDVVGLNRAQIIRRFPQPDSMDTEDNYLASVELDRPELPWLFSPFAPDKATDRLQPWIALVVCDSAVSDILPPAAPGLPEQLKTRRSELPPLSEAWAWAHAQVHGNLAPGGPSVADRLSGSHAPTNLSRLLCPRKLEGGHSYIAALVPTFRAGVEAASGREPTPADGPAPAWDDSASDGEIVLPIFDCWRFAVKSGGDFEELARRLHGVPAPWNVGRRLIDASDPRGGLPKLAANAPGRVQVLLCALVSPTPVPAGVVASENEAWDVAMRDQLRAQVDLSNDGNPALPRVGARLYARFQRGAAALGPVFGNPPTTTAAADGDWFFQLNTSPMHRLVAGLGTRVVQKDQDKLMEAAWNQIGEIRKANEALARLQFARWAGEALHRNHLSRLPVGELLQTLRGVHAKVTPARGVLTLKGTLDRSAVAPTATTAAFRRATRVRGPLARFLGAAGAAPLRQLLASEGRFVDMRRTYREPEGVRTLSPASITSFSPASLAQALGVPAAAAPAALAARINARAVRPSVADFVARPIAQWRIPTGTIDLGQRGGTEISSRVTEVMPARPGSDAARAEALAPLLVGVRNSNVGTSSTRAGTTLTTLAKAIRFDSTAKTAGLPGNIGLIRPPRPTTPVVIAPFPPGGGAVRPPPQRLRFENATSRLVTTTFSSARTVSFSATAAAVSQLMLQPGATTPSSTPERPALTLTRERLLGLVAPAASMAAYVRSRVRIAEAWTSRTWFDPLRAAPILAAPRFDRAMFQALDDYDRDWLVPGLARIQQTDFVTVLATNPQFTESFLVGLSDEMGRELLWRGFPTDQRGTYFRRFWDQSKDELKSDLHRFTQTPLGSHLATAGADVTEGRVVLVVRGEIVRRFPHALFLAKLARATDPRTRHPIFSDDPRDTAKVLFRDHLEPDILLVAFDLTPSQIQSEPWWFLITEHPSAPRFGLDHAVAGSPVAASPVKRNNLDWNDLGALRGGRFLSVAARTGLQIQGAGAWPGNAAVVAYALLQNPARAAFNAQKLIAPALAPS